MQRRIHNALFAMTVLAVMAIGSSARASFHLGVEIFVNGTPVFLEFEGGAFDLNPSPNTFTVDVAALNPILAGFNLELDALRLFSNTLPGAPGFGEEGVLSQTGAVRHLGGTGTTTLEVWATAIDYTFPSDPIVMETSTSATFTDAGSGNQTEFQSFFGPGNFYFDTSVASPLLTVPRPPGLSGSGSANASPTGTPGTLPYSLTNVARITVGPQPAEIGWSGSTVVVPEPAALSLFLLGLPAVVLFRRRARQRQAV